MTVRACIAAIMLLSTSVRAPAAAEPTAPSRIWDRGNLAAWCDDPSYHTVIPPERRAELWSDLGIGKAAYYWRAQPAHAIDAELAAVEARGIKLTGIAFHNGSEDKVRDALAAIARHRSRPDLWIMQDFSGLNEQNFAIFFGNSFAKTSADQREKIDAEARRIAALARLAKPLGLKILLYNHNGWLGMVENQIEIIERLSAMGVRNVGIVYNFSHALDVFHDDRPGFAALWRRMRPYVGQVNINAVRMDNGAFIYPSQGEGEIEMMRIIAESGWRGPIGIVAEKCVEGVENRPAFTNYLTGLDWIADHLRDPSTAGDAPQTCPAGTRSAPRRRCFEPASPITDPTRASR